MVVIQDDLFRFVFRHPFYPECIAQPIRIPGIIDMAIHVNIGVDRSIFRNELFSLKVADCGREIHGDGQIPVVRDQAGNIAGRQHPPCLCIQKQPEGPRLTDHLPTLIGHHIIPGKKTDACRHGKGVQGDLFTCQRITGHMKLAAGKPIRRMAS